MKYINLVNEFWRLNAIEPFSSTDISVYFYLLNQCNLRHWENPFSVTIHQMEVALNISRKTILMSRNRLQKRGLLTIKSRGKKAALLILTDCDAPSEGQETTHCGKQKKEQSGNKPETNATHIKREKNKEKRYIKKHSIECQKSERVPEKSECVAMKCVAVAEKSNTARYEAVTDRIQENIPSAPSPERIPNHLLSRHVASPRRQLHFSPCGGKVNFWNEGISSRCGPPGSAP